MRWKALATDFDGTIATDGVVDEPTKQALLRLQQNGIQTLLVTGRELEEFRKLNLHLPMFDLVVAENGAVMFHPSTGKVTALSKLPPEAFMMELTRRGVKPLSVGASIVATVEPHEVTVLEVIKEMGLELHVIFNKGAVMILPSGVNKATGLVAALKTMKLKASDVVAVGDAENDHTFLDQAGFPAAVANAQAALKQKALYVAEHSAGAGVVELIDGILAGKFEDLKRPEAKK